MIEVPDGPMPRGSIAHWHTAYRIERRGPAGRLSDLAAIVLLLRLAPARGVLLSPW